MGLDAGLFLGGLNSSFWQIATNDWYAAHKPFSIINRNIGGNPGDKAFWQRSFAHHDPYETRRFWSSFTDVCTAYTVLRNAEKAVQNFHSVQSGFRIPFHVLFKTNSSQAASFLVCVLHVPQKMLCSCCSWGFFLFFIFTKYINRGLFRFILGVPLPHESFLLLSFSLICFHDCLFSFPIHTPVHANTAGSP